MIDAFTMSPGPPTWSRDMAAHIAVSIVVALSLAASSAGADPTTFWGQFPVNVTNGVPYTIPLGTGSQVTATMTTGGSQGMHGVSLDTLGRSATALDYSQLNVLGIFNGGGSAAVTTTITISDVQMGTSHKRGLLMVGAVNGLSSPITVTSSVPGRVATFTLIGSFDYTPDNSAPISWNPGSGTFQTGAPIANDSRCIVIDLGDLETDGTLTISLNQWLNDGIVFAIGEEWLPNVGVPPSSAQAVTFRPLHPNPARNSATLAFSLPTASPARIDLFDVSGRHLARLVDRTYDAGTHTLHWDLRDHAGARVPAGLVFARLATPDGVLTRRVLVTH